MQNINVRRYKQPAPGGFQGSIEPEDCSWVIFIDKDDHATFWRRGELELPVGLVNVGEVISNEVWYDVESVTLPSADEALAAENQQGA